MHAAGPGVLDHLPSISPLYLPYIPPTSPLHLPYQVCSSISEVYDTHECYVLVVLDLPRIAELHLHVS